MKIAFGVAIKFHLCRFGTQLAKKGFRVLELHSIEVRIAVCWFMMLT